MATAKRSRDKCHTVKDILNKKDIQIEQYAFETKNLDGANEKFLEKTAPLIGYIVHSFNTLEELLNSAICEILFDDSDYMGLQVIYRRSYMDKVLLFERLLIGWQSAVDDEIPIFQDIISNLKEAGNLRNIVVHADWESAHADGYTQCKLKINAKGIQHEYVQFTPKSLRDILRLINKTTKMFDRYEEKREALGL